MKFNILRKAANLALMALGLAMVSCSTDSADLETDATADERELITFTVSSDTQTRGSIMGSADFTSFVLYAKDSQGTMVVGSEDEGALFTYDSDSKTYTTTAGSFYWTGYPVTFCAYAVNTADEVDNGVTFDAEHFVFGYTMPEDVTKQPDLLIATTTLSSGTVSLDFTRAFALVQFNAFGATGFTIESVSMSNFDDGGVYTVEDSQWVTGPKDTTPYVAGITQGVTLTSDNTVTITNSTGYMMVLPQTTTGVEIYATDSNGNSKTYTVDVEWKAGYLYTYTVDSENLASDSLIDFEVTDASADLTLKTGDTVTLGLTSAEGVSIISYSSDNDAVATVDKDGVITTVGAGTATITVTLTVNDYIVELTITIEVSESESGEGDGSGDGDDSGSTGGDFDYDQVYTGTYVNSDGTTSTSKLSTSIGFIYYVDATEGYALAIDLDGETKDTSWSNTTGSVTGAYDADCGYYNTYNAKGVSDVCEKCWSKGSVEKLQTSSDPTKGQWYLPARYELDKVANFDAGYSSGTYNGTYDLYKLLGICSAAPLWSSTQSSATDVYVLYSDSAATSTYVKSGGNSGSSAYIAVIRF